MPIKRTASGAHRTVAIIDAADPAGPTSTTDNAGTAITIPNTSNQDDDVTFFCSFSIASGAPASCSVEARYYDVTQTKWFPVPGSQNTLTISSGTTAKGVPIRVNVEGLPVYCACTAISGTTPSLVVSYSQTVSV